MNKKDYSYYSISSKPEYKSLELIKISEIISLCTKDWQNLLLCEVDDHTVRLAVIKGEFHWHSHKESDEFFYVIEGKLFIDLEEKTITVVKNQAFLVPKGVQHRTRASVRTVILVFEKGSTKLTGTEVKE